MPSHDLAFMPASDLSVAIRTKRVSPAEAVDAVLDRIQRLNPRLNAFCTVTAESARREAQAAEAAVMRGDRLGPLHGVPLSVGDGGFRRSGSALMSVAGRGLRGCVGGRSAGPPCRVEPDPGLRHGRSRGAGGDREGREALP